MDSVEWAKWEEISLIIETIDKQPHDG
jgi:hypothetical protein